MPAHDHDKSHRSTKTMRVRAECVAIISRAIHPHVELVILAALAYVDTAAALAVFALLRWRSRRGPPNDALPPAATA